MQSSRWFLALALGAALGSTGPAPGVMAQSGEAAPDRGAPHAGTSQPGPSSAPEGVPHAAQVTQGRRLYAQLCSNCHGIRMVNPGTSSFDLRKFPHDEKARFVNAVTHGKNTMPAWGDMLKPEEIEVLWAYVLTGGRP
jgi:mono/diheme cytochrome c family protein